MHRRRRQKTCPDVCNLVGDAAACALFALQKLVLVVAERLQFRHVLHAPAEEKGVRRARICEGRQCAGVFGWGGMGGKGEEEKEATCPRNLGVRSELHVKESMAILFILHHGWRESERGGENECDEMLVSRPD